MSTRLSGASSMTPRLMRHSQLGRAQLDEYASRVMALDGEGESFVQKIHRLFTEAGDTSCRPCMNPVHQHVAAVSACSML